MILTNHQIDFLEQELQTRGITVPSLAEDLLDHFCCSIEQEMGNGLAFEEAYRKTYLEVCPDGLREINHETQLIVIHQKHSTMKKLVFILGFIAAFTFVTGYIFKLNSWPTANLNMTIGGLLFSLGFLPMYFVLKYRIDQSLNQAKSKGLYVLNFAMVAFICIGGPYKVLDWPGANVVFFGGLLLFLLVFLPKVFLSWYKKTGELRMES